KDIQVTPKDFGAVGDGLSDDTQALRSFFSSAYTRKHVGIGTYLLKESITVELNSNIITSEGFIVSDLVDSTMVTITGDNNYIRSNMKVNKEAETGIYSVEENKLIIDLIVGNLRE